MLQIKHINKTYKTGPFVQKALNDLSLDLRDCEFVAILGQSGSGKTTLLNVIGGLDHYDSGDLIINGVSTKKYKARDWDAYRNHSVGFVFQSYNLIPHQTILKNVELALTIGGVSRGERTNRAKEALEKVGLGEHIHKKPSQLSGGQMQRVAIARALVNDPEILLADEPTGALDSETSVQVMDLLKEVAKDRLVVMVTHNPELAEEYATRIVRLHDGRIIADSDPFEAKSNEAEHKKPGRTSMSFLTALNLSLNNLWTKKVRTLLVAFAGSIGIIGIAMILSLSNGANNYIKDTEENTLKSYPLKITSSGMDLSSFLSDTASATADEAKDGKAEVREWNMVTKMFSRVTKNDLKSLREYIEDETTKIRPNSQAVEYDYNITPYIYKLNGEEVRQVNPDTSFAQLGFNTQNSMNSMMSAWSSTDCFEQLPAEDKVYRPQYDVKAGRWPEKYNECVLVLTKNGRVSDLTLYATGKKDPKQLDKIVHAFAQGQSSKEDVTAQTYAYKDFLGIEFRLVPASSMYTYESKSKSWVNRAEDSDFMKKLVKEAETIKIVGVVQPGEDTNTMLLNEGIAYPASMTKHLMGLAAKSDVVKAQLKNSKTNILTGKAFGEKNDKSDFDLSSLFTFDENAMKKLFSLDSGAKPIDTSSLDYSQLDFSKLNLSNVIDTDSMSLSMPSLTEKQMSELISSVKFDISSKEAQSLFDTLVDGYLKYASKNPSTDYSKLTASITSYLNSESARTVLSDKISAAISKNAQGLITTDDMQKVIADIMSGFSAYAATKPITSADDISNLLSDYLASEEVAAKINKMSSDINGRLAAIELTEDQVSDIASALYTGYQTYAKENKLPDPQYVLGSFSEYMNTDDAKKTLSAAVAKSVDTTALQKKATQMVGGMSSSVEKQFSGLVSSLSTALQKQLGSGMQTLAGQLQGQLQNAFSFNKGDLTKMFSSTMSANEMRDLFNSLLSSDTNTTQQSVLTKLGYADEKDPYSITIYPQDFESKNTIKSEIERYNDAQRKNGKDEKVIVYTDIVDTLMSSVTQIVDAISAILIAFVAISLLVSSVMIGVITYISVLERKKEIGILRAIGASKRNISNVFNAETFIIGALAGVLGVGITLLAIIPANHIIHELTGQHNVNASLPPLASVILVLLSIALTLIGGIIPSHKAANSDPVSALRSE